MNKFICLIFATSISFSVAAEIKPLQLGFGAIECSYALNNGKLKSGAEQWIYGYLTAMGAIEALDGNTAFAKVIGQVTNQDITKQATDFCVGSPDKTLTDAGYTLYRKLGGRQLIRY